MSTVRQRTLRSSVEFEGVGLHSGEPCRIVVRPVSDNAGIVFRRSDLEAEGRGDREHLLVPADPRHVLRTDNGTTLTNKDGVAVVTVEHLMAAFALLSIDNAFVDVYGPEIPILDGSAALFISAFKAAGFTEQKSPRAPIVVEDVIEVSKGDRFVRIEPSDVFSLDVSIAFEDCLIGRQSVSLRLEDADALDRLAKSRTFCRLSDIDALRAAGLVKGGSLENSLVVDGAKLYADQELRDPQEFALHKALDLIGDLYLLGRPLLGAVIAEKPGHDLNVRAARAVLEQGAGSAEKPGWVEAATA